MSGASETSNAAASGAADRPQRIGGLVAAFLALTALHLWATTCIRLHVDEAYYWEWSRRLDWSYYDHPALVAWIIRLSTELFGTNEFAIHLPAVALTAISSLLLGALTAVLYPGQRRLAWATVVVCNLIPLLSLGALFTTPDPALAVFWLATVLLVRLALGPADGSRERPWLWYLAGLNAGVGLLAKYNMVLLPPALLLYLALTPARRPWLRRKEPWIAVGLMLLFLAPIVIWNAQHDWASFRFHLAERHPHKLVPHQNLVRFIANQLTYSPVLLGVCVWAGVRAVRRRRDDDASWFAAVCGLFVLVFFAGAGLLTLTMANWTALGWTLLLVPAMKALGERRTRWLTGLTVGFAAFMTAVMLFQAVTNRIPLPPGADYTLQLHGLDGLGVKLREVRNSLPNPERAFVFAHRFQMAAVAAYYAGPEVEVTRLGERHDQYDFWRPDDEHLRGRDAVFVCVDNWYQDPTNRYPFRKCEPAGEHRVMRGGVAVRTYSLWRCFDYLGRSGEAAPSEISTASP